MTSNVETPASVRAEVSVGTPARARSRMSRFGRSALILAACAVLAGGGYYAWQTWFAQGSSASTVLTAVVTRGNLEDTVTATGTLQPKDYVDVGTQVSGQLKKLLVDIGAVVTKGQLLAEIDPTVYQSKVDADHAQLLNQQAQIADKQAQLVLAQLQFTRQQNLARDDATTKDALQIAEATQQSALAQLDAFRAQMKQTESTLHGDEANLGYTKIYAPMAGTVVSQTAKQGQTLNANQQAPIIMRIADLSTMTVEAQVSEADVPKLRIGMDVYFTTLGGDNRRFYGKLRQIPPTPTVVNNVVLYDALFDVANPDQVLMTQMTAQVFFVASSARDAVLVPLTALRPVAAEGPPSGPRLPAVGTADGKGAVSTGGAKRASGADPRNQFANGRALVSVVGADGKAAEREVKVGVMNRVSAQIIAGLEPGEKVVIGTRAPASAAPAPAQTSSSLVPGAPRAGGGRP
ncbi:MAG TPA: efflux RND transporter periplasmic adaptor subunit [Burkholderiales bacterium]